MKILPFLLLLSCYAGAQTCVLINMHPDGPPRYGTPEECAKVEKLAHKKPVKKQGKKCPPGQSLYDPGTGVKDCYHDNAIFYGGRQHASTQVNISGGTFKNNGALVQNGEAAPKPEPIDIPAIQEERVLGTTLDQGCFEYGVSVKCHTHTRALQTSWTCTDKRRILEHDEQVPPHYYCRKPQLEAP